MAEHPLDGIREKLKRADQCIRNLDTEIVDFLKRFPTFDFPTVRHGVDQTFTDDDSKAWKKFGQEFLACLTNESVPLRIRVLAGEVIHHLRSCFDHLIWQLSDERLRNTGTNAFSIDFPVFDTDPARDPKKSGQYNRKVQFIISRPEALARIERLQPHHAVKPLYDPLWLIHDMDRMDKHRELNIAVAQATGRLEGVAVRAEAPVYKAGVPVGVVVLSEMTNLEMNARISAQVAFSNVSDGEFEAVIPFLTRLHHFTVDTIELFASEFA